MPLILQFGPVANVSNGTTVRILGAALLALAVGAFTTARDPWHHLVTLRVEIVFTALASVFLALRLLSHGVAGNRASYLLPLAVTALVLQVVLYPRRESRGPCGGEGGEDGQGQMPRKETPG